MECQSCGPVLTQLGNLLCWRVGWSFICAVPFIAKVTFSFFCPKRPWRMRNKYTCFVERGSVYHMPVVQQSLTVNFKYGWGKNQGKICYLFKFGYCWWIQISQACALLSPADPWMLHAPGYTSMALGWWKPVKSPVEVRRKRATCPEEKKLENADANRRLKTLSAMKWMQPGRKGVRRRAWGPAVGWSWEVAEQGRVLRSRARARGWGKSQGRRQADRAEGCREPLNGGATFQLPDIMWWCLVPGRPIPKVPCSQVLLLLLHALSAGVFSSSLHPWPGLFPIICHQPCPLLIPACLPELFCAALQRGSEMPHQSRQRCREKKARGWCNEEV